MSLADKPGGLDPGPESKANELPAEVRVFKSTFVLPTVALTLV